MEHSPKSVIVRTRRKQTKPQRKKVDSDVEDVTLDDTTTLLVDDTTSPDPNHNLQLGCNELATTEIRNRSIKDDPQQSVKEDTEAMRTVCMMNCVRVGVLRADNSFDGFQDEQTSRKSYIVDTPPSSELIIDEHSSGSQSMEQSDSLHASESSHRFDDESIVIEKAAPVVAGGVSNTTFLNDGSNFAPVDRNGIKSEPVMEVVPSAVNCAQCPHCHKLFRGIDTLNDHMQLCHSDRSTVYACQQCDAIFADRDKLKKHKATHDPVCCKVCKKTFANDYRLDRHMISHNESAVVRKFKCPHCGKAFKFKHHLKEHIRIHSGEKPFRCGNCDKRFSHSGSFSSHNSSKKCLILNLRVNNRNRANSGAASTTATSSADPKTLAKRQLQRQQQPQFSQSATNVSIKNVSLSKEKSPNMLLINNNHKGVTNNNNINNNNHIDMKNIDINNSTNNSNNNNLNNYINNNNNNCNNNNNNNNNNNTNNNNNINPNNSNNYNNHHHDYVGDTTTSTTNNNNNNNNSFSPVALLDYSQQFSNSIHSFYLPSATTGLSLSQHALYPFRPSNVSEIVGPLSSLGGSTYCDSMPDKVAIVEEVQKRILLANAELVAAAASVKKESKLSDAEEENMEDNPQNEDENSRGQLSMLSKQQHFMEDKIATSCDAGTMNKYFQERINDTVTNQPLHKEESSCGSSCASVSSQVPSPGIDEFSRSSRSHKCKFCCRSFYTRKELTLHEEFCSHDDRKPEPEGLAAKLQEAVSNCPNTSLNGAISSSFNSDSEDETQESGKECFMTEDEECETLVDNRKSRVRSQISEEQAMVMKQFYAQNPKPKREDLEKMSQRVGLQVRVVQVWFQNNRARDRREGRLVRVPYVSEYAALPVPLVASGCNSFAAPATMYTAVDASTQISSTDQPLDLSTKKTTVFNCSRVRPPPAALYDSDECGAVNLSRKSSTSLMPPVPLEHQQHQQHQQHHHHHHHHHQPHQQRLVADAETRYLAATTNERIRGARLSSTTITSYPNKRTLYTTRHRLEDGGFVGRDAADYSRGGSRGSPLCTSSSASQPDRCSPPPANLPEYSLKREYMFAFDTSDQGKDETKAIFKEETMSFDQLSSVDSQTILPTTVPTKKRKLNGSANCTTGRGSASSSSCSSSCSSVNSVGNSKHSSKSSPLVVSDIEGERPHKCDICTKRFKHKHHLTEHNRLHTGEKPFQCNKCLKRFSHSGSYSQHMNHRYSYCKPYRDA